MLQTDGHVDPGAGPRIHRLAPAFVSGPERTSTRTCVGFGAFASSLFSSCPLYAYSLQSSDLAISVFQSGTTIACCSNLGTNGFTMIGRIPVALQATTSASLSPMAIRTFGHRSL